MFARTLKITAAVLAGSLLFAHGPARAQEPAPNRALQVNVFTGTQGVGLTSGYLYP